MPTECSQTNIPSKNTHRGDGAPHTSDAWGVGHKAELPRETKSRKGSLLWSSSYKDHNTTGAKQQLKGFEFRESKLDLSSSSGLQEERLWSACSACFSRGDQRRGKTVESGHGARISRSAGELGQDLTYLLHFSIIGRPSPSLLVSQVL